MARNFFARQGDLTPRYFVYRKENQRRMAEKGPAFGHVDIFQTRPKSLRIFIRRGGTLRGPSRVLCRRDLCEIPFGEIRAKSGLDKNFLIE